MQNAQKESIVKKFEVYATVLDLRHNSPNFDALVSEINSKFKEFSCDQKNFEASLFKKPKINITVSTEFPLTKDEKIALIRYLYDKYIDIIPGDFFIIRKCWFSRRYKYRIKSAYLSNDFYNLCCGM